MMSKLFRKGTKLALLMFALVLSSFTAIQAQRTVNGVVLDETGTSLPGASVLVKGTSNGVSTDFDGKFSLELKTNENTLIISYIGYQTKEVTITGSDYLEITLSQEAESLDEVVVTALGIKREEKALGYAVQEVKGESLQKVPGIDVATSLSGKVAGVLIENPTDFNATPKITILGETPLIVIDGIAYPNKSLNDISSEDIESLSTLKGPTASALYGFRGRTGAILITTKNGSSSSLGVSVDLSTNTMFTAGYLAIPEKQSVYGRGENNTYEQTKDQSWGGAMDGSIQKSMGSNCKRIQRLCVFTCR